MEKKSTETSHAYKKWFQNGKPFNMCIMYEVSWFKGKIIEGVERSTCRPAIRNNYWKIMTPIVRQANQLAFIAVSTNKCSIPELSNLQLEDVRRTAISIVFSPSPSSLDWNEACINEMKIIKYYIEPCDKEKVRKRAKLDWWASKNSGCTHIKVFLFWKDSNSNVGSYCSYIIGKLRV